ncbi:MAG: ATP-dependent zinc metalloprotease FtsH [Actinobacteria bacterium]|nr:ATP-dependent zinc metalloprotease FtsH [Actinomycetota bacterium]
MTKQASPPPPGDKPSPSAPPPPPSWRHWLWPAAIFVALALWIALPAAHSTPQVSLTYSQFQSKVSAHQVKSIDLAQSGQTSTGVLTDNKNFTTVVPAQAGSSLLSELQSANVQITATETGASFGSEVLSWAIILLPLLLFGYLWFRLSRNAAGGGGLQGLMGVGRSRAKVFDAEKPSTRFADVAGYDGAKREISEVVDFLKEPDRYKAVGAVPPRGVLMVGPPGTGKTLIARAVAGEADVPFFSVAGSSFVELFVGVGAARVRDLFSEARKRAPCIIFVDEIDAIGQRRSGGQVYASNDEREQTLNQLLAEMDGFDPVTGIVVLAATNRPEVLDPALLRPGRFDRQVTIPLPNVSERAAILAVHCRGKQVAPDVDLNAVARGTPGFSGADLANLANEAAIFAVRAGRQVITAADFDAARDRVLLGRREDSNVLLPEEKRSVAFHEAGHAMVAALSPKADPVAKVTILPAGQALGVTEQLPLVERHLYSEDYLYQSLAVRLGGRSAELVKFNQGSTGASNDLASATELAVRMVREFGLSPALGPVGYPTGGSMYLGDGGAVSSRPFAESTQAEIDREVSRLLREAEQQAVSLLKSHEAQLDQLAGLLLDQETVSGETVYELLGLKPPERIDDAATVAPPLARAGSEPAAPAAGHPAATAVAEAPAGSAPEGQAD